MKIISSGLRQKIDRNAKRLLTLINDIIRLSELDADDMEVAFSDVDLYGLAETCVESLRLNAESHGIHIECSGMPCIVHGNKKRNAWKSCCTI